MIGWSFGKKNKRNKNTHKPTITDIKKALKRWIIFLFVFDNINLSLSLFLEKVYIRIIAVKNSVDATILKQNIILNIRRICGLLLFKKSYKSLPQKIDAIILL